jgi:hypothetical protein
MPTRYGKEQGTKADQRLAAALRHPLRAECLTILNARVASPAEVSRELDVPLGNVSYHIKELVKYDCVELVETKAVRGATEHFYRGVAQKYLHDDLWFKLSHAVRNGISMTGIRVIIGAIRDSVAAGIFDRKKGRHLSVVTYQLDGAGWEELRALHKETLDRSMALAARSEGRIAEGKAKGGAKKVRATTVQLAFESPPGSPKNHELGEVFEL